MRGKIVVILGFKRIVNNCNKIHFLLVIFLIGSLISIYKNTPEIQVQSK